MKVRVRWDNVGRAAAVAGVAALVVAWPRLGSAPPRLPSDAAVPLVGAVPVEKVGATRGQRRERTRSRREAALGEDKHGERSRSRREAALEEGEHREPARPRARARAEHIERWSGGRRKAPHELSPAPAVPGSEAPRAPAAPPTRATAPPSAPVPPSAGGSPAPEPLRAPAVDPVELEFGFER